MGNFFAELKRRKVFRVAAIYAAVAWVLTQIVVVVEAPLALPNWIDTAVILFLALGFPVALILAYAFDVTPDGVARTENDADRGSAKAYGAVVLVSGVVIAALYVWGYVGIPGVRGDSDRAGGIAASASPLTDLESPVPGFSGRAAIAVLPFLNISDDPEQEYLADGITEDILTGLQAFKSFPVIARTSTFTYKGKARDVREIAKELGAGYILEGSVRRVGDNVRITGQLINASGEHLWADRYDVAWADIVTLQDEITAAIISTIEPEILMTESARVHRVPTEDMEAWDYYLRARSDAAANLGFTTLSGEPLSLEGSKEALKWAKLAVENDQRFAAAYSLLGHIEGAYTFQLRHLVSDEEAAVAMERSLAYSEQARLIDPFEPSSCSCQALLYLMKGEVERASELQEEAVLVNPSSSIVHAALAKILELQGDYDRALDEINLAIRLSPQDMAMTTYLTIKAGILQSMGNFIEADRMATRAIFMVPGNVYGHAARITAKLALGDRPAAQAAMDELYRHSPGWAPINLWAETFPASVASAVGGPMGEALDGSAYDVGLKLILEDLASDLNAA